MRRRLPDSFYNPISLIGVVMAVFNAAFAAFLAIAETFTAHHRPYADLVIFLVLPALVLFGIVLMIIGIRRERQRQRVAPGKRLLLIVDFNEPRNRTVVVTLLTGFLVLSLLYAFAGYKVYEYTESDTFCARLCHTVHNTEDSSHAFSVHARIGCSACHVGSSIKYFVLYKMKGTRQLFDILTDHYPRPIPTPVADLRPSQDVCENCHGPKYQINQRLESRTYFLADKKNTRKTINLLLRMGKTEQTTEKPLRMHWHYSTSEDIVYAATDPKRTVIPWVRVKRLDGKVRVYRAIGAELSDMDAAKIGTRRMDCVDCHNRPGHPFNSPDVVLDALLATNLVDPGLPEVKRAAVKALEAEYPSKGEAHSALARSIREFYQKTYPDAASSQQAAIEQAIGELQRAFDRNYDPHMKMSWKNFPNNQGHRFSPGCFRCHDGKHRSDDGVVLSRDCGLCHLLIERAGKEGSGRSDRAVFQVMKYPHPTDIGDAWKEMLCHECHGAGQ